MAQLAAQQASEGENLCQGHFFEEQHIATSFFCFEQRDYSAGHLT
jgi:hypothetical protein